MTSRGWEITKIWKWPRLEGTIEAINCIMHSADA